MTALPQTPIRRTPSWPARLSFGRVGRWVAGFLCFALIFGAGVWYAVDSVMVRYETQFARRMTIQREVRRPGKVVPSRSEDLRVTAGGKVSSIGATPGDWVKAGQPLIRLENAAAVLAADQTRLALASERLRLEGLVEEAYGLRVTAPASGYVTGLALKRGDQAIRGAVAAAIRGAATVPVGGTATAAPAQADTSSTLAVEGRVVAHEEETLMSLSGGTVRAVLVSEGQAVEAGQILVEVSNPDLVVQAELAAQAVEAARGRAEFVPGRVVAGDDEALAALSPGTVRTVLAAEDDAVQAGQVLVELDNPTLVIQRDQAKLTLDNQEKRFDTIRGYYAADDPYLLSQELSLRQARVNYAQLKANVEALSVTAPRTGVVRAISVRIGQAVVAGTTVVRLREAGVFYVSIAVPVDRLATAPRGGAATVDIPEMRLTGLTAEVIRVADQGVSAASGTTVEVTLRVSAPAGSTSAAAGPTPAPAPGTAARVILRTAASAGAGASSEAELLYRRESIRLAQLRDSVAGLKITAPRAGTVTGLSVRMGQTLTAGTPVARLRLSAVLHCSFQLGVAYAGHVVPGDQVRLDVPDWGLRGLTAVVVKVGDLTSTAGQARFEIVVRSAVSSGPPPPGVPARAHLAPAGGAHRTAGETDEPLRLAAGGTVTALHVVDGDWVTAGQVIATLRNDGLVTPGVPLPAKPAPSAATTGAAARGDLVASFPMDPQLTAVAGPTLRESMLKWESLLVSYRIKLEEAAGLTVTSPIDGLLLAVKVRVGDQLAPGALAAVVAGSNEYDVVTDLSGPDAARLTVGRTAYVRLASDPAAPLEATIAEIGRIPTSGSSDTFYPVRLRLGSAAVLPSGLACDVEFPAQVKTGALAVPTEAIQTLYGESSIRMVLNPHLADPTSAAALERTNRTWKGKTKVVYVITGVSNGIMTEVVRGLMDGDEIVVRERPNNWIRVLRALLSGGRIIIQEPATPR